MDATASKAVADATAAPAGPRSFPQDFPRLRHCRDGPQLAAGIAGAAASLTSVDLQPRTCMCYGVMLMLGHSGVVFEDGRGCTGRQQ